LEQAEDRAGAGACRRSQEVSQATRSGSRPGFANGRPFRRCDDLTNQNALLHEHLETFNSQAAHLQARQATSNGGGVSTEDPDSIDAITAGHNSSVDQLRQVIRYLRGEKDIVDFQLELSKQEATRLRTQLEFTTRNLEETRQSLTEVLFASFRTECKLAEN
jgi:hypothetical protein